MDENQVREHIRTTLNSSFFIKAGAGAGKTRMVVERVVEQLKADYNPENIVVITFTEKAAQELLERILSKLNDAAQTDKKVAEKLKNINRMQISTIHSFCNTLIKEQIFSAKLPIGTELLQDEQLQQRIEKFFRENLHTVNNAKITKLQENYDARTFMKHLLIAFKQIYSLPESTKIIYHEELLSNTDETYQEKFDTLFKEIREYAFDIYNNNCNCSVREIGEQNKSVFLADFVKMLKFRDSEAMVKSISSNQTLKVFNSRSNVGKSMQAEMDNFISFKVDDTDALVKEYEAFRHALISDVAVELRELYISKRNSEARDFITNDDLLQIACRLICENKEAWEYYSGKYRCIYVDEFQDTDHVQSQMIKKLCSVSFDSDVLQPGKLVVVGDAKQSIYRFRGADLPEYRRVENFYEQQSTGSAEIHNLAFNFRSSKKVINWVNDNFGCAIENYEPMEAKKNHPAVPSHINPSLVIEGVYPINPHEELGANDIVQIDSIRLCNIIGNLVGRYYIYDKEQREYRLIEYRDFLLLVQKTTDMSAYTRALIRHGIPVNLAGKVDVSQIREMNRFVRFFQYLAKPFSDNNTKEALLQELSRSPVSLLLVGDDVIKELKEKTAQLSPCALATYLLHHLEYVLDSCVSIEKEKLVLLQCRLQQMVEFVLANYEENASAMIDGFRLYIDTSVERELSLSEDANAVRFMNVHKSKGLEGNIVIVFNRKQLKERPPQPYQQYQDIEERYWFYPSYPLDPYGKTALCGYRMDAEVLEASEKESKSEMVRLEYVTATRAEEALIVFSGYKDNAFMCRYNYDIADNDAYCNGTLIPFANDAEIQEQNPDDLKPGLWDAVVCDDAKEKAYSERCPSSMEEEKRAVSISEDRPRGKEFGTIMHRCFELCAFSLSHGQTVDKKLIVNQAMMENDDELAEGNLKEKADAIRNYLLMCVSRYLVSPLAKRIKEAKQTITEMPFYYCDNDEWIHGFADLVLINQDDSILIVDYKSDCKADNETVGNFEEYLFKTYGKQLELYTESIKRLFENENVLFEFYHLYQE